jgi:hypothetical protein
MCVYGLYMDAGFYPFFYPVSTNISIHIHHRALHNTTQSKHACGLLFDPMCLHTILRLM